MNLVYFHGLGGSKEDWQEIAHVVPGEAMDIPSHADDFLGTCRVIADQLEAKRNLILCGYSLGGRVALQVAALLRRRPLGLVLLASGVGLELEEERASRKATDRAWAELAKKDPDQFWRDWYAQEIFSSMRRLPAGRLSPWIERRKLISPERVAHHFSALSLANQPYQLPLLREMTGMSVLYIAGELDKKYSAIAGDLATISGVETAILPGVGHVLPLEAPGEVSRRLQQFLRKMEKR